MKRLQEDKTRLIRNLSNLSDVQQDWLIQTFRKYPHLESQVDWNRKDLTWAELFDIAAKGGKSKSQARKHGLPGLIKGHDYEIIRETKDYIVYYPMTHLGAKVLGSPKVSPEVDSKWCICTNDPHDWIEYTHMGIDFFFLFEKDNLETGKKGDKFAICRYPEEMKLSLLPRMRAQGLKFNVNEPLCEIFSAGDHALTRYDYTTWPFTWPKSELNKYPSYFENPKNWKDLVRQALENSPYTQS